MRPLQILALGLLLLLPGNQRIPLIDRDEPRFAQATVEMIQRGEWVIPYFNGEYRFDKPPLTYWLMRAGYAIFGVNEFGARFHSVACAVGVAMVIFALGRRMFSENVGVAAAIGWLTCLQLQIHGRAAVADMPMVLCVTAAMWAIWKLIHPHPCPLPVGEGDPPLPAGERTEVRESKWFFVLYLSLGLGFLAKGPIALLVPALSLILWRFVFWRKPVAWGNLRLSIGLPIALLIIAAWGIPALVRTHGEFWRVGMGEHVIERGTKAFNARRFLPIYYPLTALASLFPWSFFLRPGWKAMRANWDERNAFLVAWFVSPFLIFSFYATQLPHYILPAFPAFFLLLGQAWEQIHRRRIALAVAVAVVVVSVQGAGVYLRAHTPAIALKAQFDAMPASAEFGFYRYREPSLVFYSGRRWKTLGTIDEVNAFVSQPGPRALVMLEAERDRTYTQEIDSVNAPGFQVQRVSGVNVAKSQPVIVRYLCRR